MVILLLWVQLALGLATIPLSAQHLDGGEMVKFMTWAQGIFTFRAGSADFIADAHIIFKLHLFLGLTILLLFPSPGWCTCFQRRCDISGDPVTRSCGRGGAWAMEDRKSVV